MRKSTTHIAAVLVLLASGGLFLVWGSSSDLADKRVDTQDVQTEEVPQVEPAEHVILVSIDGLRADHVTPELMPELSALIDGGASTLNARTDPDYTGTIPNHTSQLTSRPMLGDNGHQVTFNDRRDTTVHAQAGEYVFSVFDVVHDNGGSTIVVSGKDKFDLFKQTWSDEGAMDGSGEDYGTNKIDSFTSADPDDAVARLIGFTKESSGKVFGLYHIRLLDDTGHRTGWGSDEYTSAVTQSDTLVGNLVDELEASGLLDQTSLIVTTDHGGPIGEKSHLDKEDPQNYTVPLVVYGHGVSSGTDLYDLNSDDRADPGESRPVVSAATQPIRLGEAGNLALDLLGLPAIPGSTHNLAQDLDY